jgi:putative DNA primase/helicase
LALTGFLAKQRVSKIDAAAIVTDLCDKSGATDKISSRLNLVEETYRKYEANETVAGYSTLEAALAVPECAGLTSAIQGLVGSMRASAIVERLVKKIAETKAPEPAVPGREKKELGASPEKLTKISMNTAVMLLDTDPDWSGVWRYDVFARKIRAYDSAFFLESESEGFSKSDITTVMRWFESRGYKISPDSAERVVDSVARKNRYHPVKDFLESCKAREGAIEDIARRVLGLTDSLHVRMLRKTLIAACRRIHKPGSQADTSLVLFGRQGGGKTSFCRILFGEWLLEDVRDIGSKELVRSMQGKWGVELAELDKILRAEPEAVKSFMTRTKDLLDRKYEHEQDAKRQCIFLGTTNSEDFLRDPSGERRWWPIPVPKVNLSAFLPDLVKAAWGEAYAAMLANEPHWLTDDEELLLESQRESYRYYDPLEEKLEDLMRSKGRLTLADVHIQLQIIAPALIKPGAGKVEDRRVVDGLKRIGCVRKHDGKKRWWVYPGYVAEVIPIDRAVSK